METLIERDIIINAYYVIYYFNQNGKKITNLKLQKLLYFLEAIYLIQNLDEKSLFNDDFYAWNFGPVSDVLYKRFKDYQNMDIQLNENDIGIAESMGNENKKYIEILFQLLGDMTAYQLVTLSHLPSSPWAKLNQKYNGNIDKNIQISKIETRDWFATLIGIEING